MAILTIIADIVAKPDQLALVQAELEKLIPVTRKEKGCLQYHLYQDNDKPTHFLFHESWESRELWQAHMNNQPIKDYRTATDGALESFKVSEMSEVAQ